LFITFLTFNKITSSGKYERKTMDVEELKILYRHMEYIRRIINCSATIDNGK
jgi:hypothetical protein